MNKFGKLTLLAGASAFALGLAMSQASAFDDVDWEWDTDINEKIKIKIDPDFEKLDPRGLVQVEMLQISIGDIKATSEVKHVYNDVASKYGEPLLASYNLYGETDPVDVHVDGTAYGEDLYVDGKAYGKVKVKGYAKDDCWWGKCDYDPVTAKGFAKLDVHGTAHGQDLDVDADGTVPSTNVRIYGDIWVPVEVPNQLVDLAFVVSQATAVANLATVEGNSAVFVHDGQFAIGGIGHKYNGPRPRTTDGLAELAMEPEYNNKFWHYDPIDNTHHDLVEIGLVAAALGLIQPADITATSKVYDIENASVESTATAIANMHSIDVEAEYATDVMVIADLVQFSYADVTATSRVAGVTADHFEGLGAVDAEGLAVRPLVTSVATAIGNYSAINVSVGE